MKINKIDSDQIKSLAEIGIDEYSIKKIERVVVKCLNDFFEKGDLKALNFVESINFINKTVNDILSEKDNKLFFRGKLKSIRKAVLGGFEIANVIGKDINFEIFPPGSRFSKSKKEKENKKQEGKEHPESFPRKFWTIQALRELKTKFTIRNSKERQDKTEPYSLFFVPEYNCTIAVANEYGKATYFLPIKNWQKFAKSHKIDDLRPDEKVKWMAVSSDVGQNEWTEMVEGNLLKMKEICEEEANNEEGQNSKEENFAGNEKKELKVSNDFEKLEEEKNYYKERLEEEIPRLIKEVGLIKYKDKYIFSFLRSNRKWGKVGNLSNLVYFPNIAFLRLNRVVEEEKTYMSNPNELKKLFKELELPVASEEEEKEYYKECIEKEIPRLIKDANLIKSKGKYIFGFLKEAKNWGKVGNLRNLINFPSVKFLKMNGVINKGGKSMAKTSEIKKLFEILKIPVASEEEEKEYYKECIEKEIPRLIKDANLIKSKGKYIFGFLKEAKNWGKVGNWGTLMSFPNAIFLRDNEIIEKEKSRMSSVKKIKKLFEVLKIPVASEEEEKEYYKECIEKEIPRLIKEIGLIKNKGKYIFSSFKGSDNWGKIGNFGKLESFPNAVFLRDNGIIEEKKSCMSSAKKIKKLFEVLKIPLANEKEEREYLESLNLNPGDSMTLHEE